ncbi:Oidioi.mRNA.OKI2018_I69.PAR.g9286.t1.cds [Oikopleura dioica]|uniref:Oidioi.mRNA.OKI2018_I69.PAR.g9286.t1.cds n=1 Tax=Oikopleura dioica TaxID=34765 RepID=A0ABN7RJZ2_OIKDI|nr:Oidioi.mRNA.OKI2018_I69.PAR.g9286.t1.cds [Oikopleura dioica]
MRPVGQANGPREDQSQIQAASANFARAFIRKRIELGDENELLSRSGFFTDYTTKAMQELKIAGVKGTPVLGVSGFTRIVREIFPTTQVLNDSHNRQSFVGIRIKKGDLWLEIEFNTYCSFYNSEKRAYSPSSLANFSKNAKYRTLFTKIWHMSFLLKVLPTHVPIDVTAFNEEFEALELEMQRRIDTQKNQFSIDFALGREDDFDERDVALHERESYNDFLTHLSNMNVKSMEHEREPETPAEELFECVSQTMLSGCDRNAASGWGATVTIIQKDKIITRKLKARMD